MRFYDDRETKLYQASFQTHRCRYVDFLCLNNSEEKPMMGAGAECKQKAQNASWVLLLQCVTIIVVVVVVVVRYWHLSRWDERGTGAPALALRMESLVSVNCKEQWESVIHGHQSLPGLLSVTALPASGFDWHHCQPLSQRKECILLCASSHFHTSIPSGSGGAKTVLLEHSFATCLFADGPGTSTWEHMYLFCLAIGTL